MSGFFDSLFGSDDDDRVVRESEFAGVQYPDEADELRESVERHLETASPAPTRDRLRGLVVPYGDYRYAGPAMGAAYGLVEAADYERLLVVAPSERVPFRGLAVGGWEAWATPLGELEVDLARIRRAVERDEVRPIDVAFEPAAALELQMPFLRRTAGGLPVAPMLVGDTDDETVAGMLEAFWDEQTLLVVATQLSRGLGRQQAEQRDRATIEAMTEHRPEAIDREATSGRMALRGAMRVVEPRGGRFELLTYRTSAEAGDSERVVGYAALAITG